MEIIRPNNIESTVLGASFLAGLKFGFWKNSNEIFATKKIQKVFKPIMNRTDRDILVSNWHNAVNILIKN